MGFSCIICHELLEELPSDLQGRKGQGGAARRSNGEVPISVAPCGHVFHTHCIQKWLLSQTAGNRHCPFCRKHILGDHCLIPMFPTMDGSPSNSSSSSTSSAQAKLIVTLERRVAQAEGELKELGELYDILGAEHDELADQLRREKLEREKWIIKATELESYKDLANDYKGRLDYLKNANKQLVDGKQELTAKLEEAKIHFNSLKMEKIMLERKCQEKNEELVSLRELFMKTGAKCTEFRDKFQGEKREKEMWMKKSKELEERHCSSVVNNESVEGPTSCAPPSSDSVSVQSIEVQETPSPSSPRESEGTVSSEPEITSQSEMGAEGGTMPGTGYDPAKFQRLLDEFVQAIDIVKSFGIGRTQNTSLLEVENPSVLKAGTSGVMITTCGQAEKIGLLCSSPLVMEHTTMIPEALKAKAAASPIPIRNVPEIHEVKTGILSAPDSDCDPIDYLEYYFGMERLQNAKDLK